VGHRDGPLARVVQPFKRPRGYAGEGPIVAEQRRLSRRLSTWSIEPTAFESTHDSLFFALRTPEKLSRLRAGPKPALKTAEILAEYQAETVMQRRKLGIVRKLGHCGCPILTDVDMIPIAIGAASTLLSGVSGAIGSGLSKLTGQSSTSESSQSSFAAHLKTATSQSSLGKSEHHHHAHGALSALANSSPSQSQTTTGSDTTAVGSVINISA